MTTQPVTLDSLRHRFPKARLHYAPSPNCTRCGGAGIQSGRQLPSGAWMGETPCACAFFGPNTQTLTRLISNAVKQLAS